MKSIRHHILPLLLLVASNVGLMAQTESGAWVIETDLSNGSSYLIPLPSNMGGPFVPTLPISEEGNSFELYATGTAWDTNVYHLDTKVVMAYSPTAAFSIATEDPYVRGDVSSGRYVRRMRADRTYSMTLKMDGLKDASTDPNEREARFTIVGLNYDPETYADPATPKPGADPSEPVAPPAYYDISDVNIGNGTYNMGPYGHSLNTLPKIDACGEMKFTVYRKPADGLPETAIAEPKIEVWPVASATIENIAQNQVFIDRIPLVIFHYEDLYPDSRTYVQIYPGPAVLGTQGTIVGTTERKMGKFYNPDMVEEPATVPQTLSVGVTGLSNYTPTDGIYTVEVITQTPFNRVYERLAKVTFEVDRVISSRGKLSTAESSTTTTAP